MDFASGYILEEEEESEEEQDCDEDFVDPECFEDVLQYECEIMEFDDDDAEIPQQQKEKKPKGSSTNTVRLPLKQLKEKSDAVLRDQLKYTCPNPEVCGAILSHIDTPLEKPDSTEKIWKCRFCGEERTIPEWPDFSNGNDIIYCQDPQSPPNLDSDSEENTVIFVLDSSGSMGTPLKPSQMFIRNPLLQLLTGMSGGAPLPMMGNMALTGSGPSSSRDDSKTRLDAMKAGIASQIEKLKATAPKTRVGVVAFNGEVTVFGDGSHKPEVVSEQFYFDYNMLLTVGQQQEPLGHVESNCDNLVKALKGMEEDGRTALGPALVVAMAMASKSKTSKIILCTDGYANVGLGNLESNSEKELESFYSPVSAYCKTQGISVSIISFDKCGIAKALGELPVETGGTLVLIKPDELELPIGDELRRKTMATDAYVKFVVHKQLYIASSDSKVEPKSNHYHLVGILHDEMSQVFTFGFRKDEKSKQERKEKKEQDQTGEETSDKFSSICEPVTDEKEQPADSGERNSSETSQSNLTTEKIRELTDEEVARLAEREDPDAANSPGTKRKRGSEEPTPAPTTNGDDSSSNQEETKEQKEEPVPTDKVDDSRASVTEEFPFQVQICYVDLNGTEAIRVWTNVKPVTGDRQQADEASNMRTRVDNLIQQSAKELFDIYNKKITGVSLLSKTRALQNEINDLLKQKLTTDVSQSLNRYLTILGKIRQTDHIGEVVASELRNFQQGKIIVTNAT